MQPQVSIITPSYNQARFLPAAMESVFRQDFPDLEYFVVDGASTDLSPKIIQDQAEKLNWWVSEPDQGQADAVNKGILRSGGEIIGWLNSDDLYLPNAVRNAVKAFREHPHAGIVFGNAVSADGDGRLLNLLEFGPRSTEELLQFRMICQPAVFMKRSVLMKAGLLDSSYHFFLDHELWIRMSRIAPLVHIPETWAVSRYHQDAKNVTMASECGKEIYRILEWAEKEKDLRKILKQQRGRIMGGAYQIHARYELDAGNSKNALSLYYQAFISWPAHFRVFWHRFLFSFLGLFGLSFLGDWYYSIKNRKPLSLDLEGYSNWPGLQSK